MWPVQFILEVHGLGQEVDAAGGLVGVINFRKSLFIFETEVGRGLGNQQL